MASRFSKGSPVIISGGYDIRGYHDPFVSLDKEMTPLIRRFFIYYIAFVSIPLIVFPSVVYISKKPNVLNAALEHPKIVTAISLIVATCLFMLRKYKPVLYGLSELSVGAATFYSSLSGISNIGWADTLKLSAGVYIMVRGLDNISKGVGESEYLRNAQGRLVDFSSPTALLSSFAGYYLSKIFGKGN